MRICIDFHRTVVDSTEAKLRYAREHLGVELLPRGTGGRRKMVRPARFELAASASAGQRSIH